MDAVDPEIWEHAMGLLQDMAAGGGVCPLCGQSLNGVCFNCGGSFPSEANYCPMCAARVAPYPPTCPACGAAVSDATVCPQCGHDLPSDE